MKKSYTQLIKKIGSEPVYGDNEKQRQKQSYGDRMQILKVKRC